MRRCRSCCVSLPHFLVEPRRGCVAAISISVSSLISWICGFRFPRQFPREGPCPLVELPADPPKICQLRSNSRVLSTNSVNVAGCGESIRSFCHNPSGKLRRKAHILVVSSALVCRAWVLHSWNQVEKLLVPIVHLLDGLHLGSRWDELLFKSGFEIVPCSIVDWVGI